MEFPKFKPIVIPFAINEYKIHAEFKVIPPGLPSSHEEDWPDYFDYPSVELSLLVPSGFLSSYPGVLYCNDNEPIPTTQTVVCVLKRKFSKPTLEYSFNAAMDVASKVVQDALDYIVLRKSRINRRKYNIKCSLESSPFELEEELDKTQSGS
jgi:hypothetical protein